MAHWLFEDRRTGRLVVAQLPNLPLWVWIVASAVSWLVHPDGTFGTVVSVIGKVALTVWALDEVARGVNPWRRIIGAGVLLLLAVALFVAA
ncbi:MAG: hypothetical protein QOJ34_1435 [Pseudonocardiales bacterium]|nr:hypothetical protein [Pseudonocardiales bacterium]